MSKFEVKKIVNYDPGYPEIKKERKSLNFKSRILFMLSFILVLATAACENGKKEKGVTGETVPDMNYSDTDQEMGGVPEYDGDYGPINPDTDQKLSGDPVPDTNYDDSVPLPDIDYGTYGDEDYELGGVPEYDGDYGPINPDNDQALGGVTDFDMVDDDGMPEYDGDYGPIVDNEPNPDNDQELAGEAIPTCEYNGKIYNAGDSFPANDGCNKCTCDFNREVSCTIMECKEN